MPSEILTIPSKDLRLATGVEGLLEVGGNILYPGSPQAFVEAADFNIQNIGFGTNGVLSCTGLPAWALGVIRIPREQPFWLNMGLGPIRSFHQQAQDFLSDDLGNVYSWFAYSNANDGQGWYYYVTFRNVQVIGGGPGIPISANANLAIRSDGTSLIWEKLVGGIWHFVYAAPIPSDVVDFRFNYRLYAVGNELVNCQRRIDEAIVPVTTQNTTFNFLTFEHFFRSRIVDRTHYGIISDYVDETVGEVSSPLVTESARINIFSEALYIRPKTGACGGIVIEGQVIEFESNGGSGGIFTATTGTILSGLKWQAPFSTGQAHFEYTIGNVTAQCDLSIVKRLTVTGVDSDGYYFPDLAQGEEVTFESTCPNALWSTDLPSSIRTPINSRTGHFVAPTDATDDVFGEKLVTITVNGCGQTYSFKVRIQALFPTPKYCGPLPLKWLQKEPDFLPNRLEMTGGTTQVKNRNPVGIEMWEVNYDLLKEDALINCTCSEADLQGHLPQCQSKWATAKRLSEFYRLVKMNKYFTLVDYHTETQYKYVRLTRFERGHNLYQTEQARSLSMRHEGDLIFDI